MVSVGGVGRHRRLDDSDSESEDKQNVLTSAKAAELCPKPFRLIARNGAFAKLDDLSKLSALDYVDLTGNNLSSLTGLEGNSKLKTLIAKGNELNNVDAVLKTEALRVLDVSDNKMTSTEWLIRSAFADALVALVLKGNKLGILECLGCLQSVETIVISNNEIEDISPVAKLPTLKKLSASHNLIRKLPKMNTMSALVELRLAHNRLTDLNGLKGLTELKILDVGHNRIESFEGIRGCHELTQVNVRGNKVDGAEFVKGICDKLEVVDGVRLKGGRRKVRINRIRMQAGFRIEKDRKFARLPPGFEETGKVMKRNDLGAQDGDKKEKGDLKQGKRKRIREQGSDMDFENDVDEEDSNRASEIPDDALDSAKFVEMAKAKGATMSAPPTDQVKEKPKRRKKVRADTATFGTGGDSKW